ncbi:16S rRNA (guanine(527)-N(7))-methyltransferase RsmG [Sphingomonas sp. HT-1]|uniref:16S rRNA (guanine(527)-N(7))-methyltransferase RsmG n=1 Tax=unclassified Sphingomonas TaxID=196159 RepID=UPI00035C76BB|nr:MULTISPECIES: 16S rRNA (guanine(527)-N(7))-methyltransferase RsmG [unclassified Sphingomonas]KTF69674.1 16S rRNA (guanine(527)-N(7))-methyltransferase RsmG [Sphingomonas sp. WG]
MTEDEARAWVRERFGVSRETLLARFGDILVEGAEHQNLIARSTLPALWGRHLADSAQLVLLATGAREGVWLDVGSGAGLPGIVVAILTERPMVLVEPRAKRVAFLRECAETLGLGDRVRVVQSKVEAFRPDSPVAVVSARAVAELSVLLLSTVSCTDSSTIWVLPKGRSAHSEVDAARAKWQGRFHVEPSITQPDSGIVVATQIGAR